MNIFILDTNPEIAAAYHADKHLSKMVLESAQMLSTVLDGPYRPTHANHPCTLWVGRSRANAEWLWHLADMLNLEYRGRYNKSADHKSWGVIAALTGKIKTLPDRGLTPFAQAMPEEYKDQDAVTAYRTYYRSKPFVNWAKGTIPEWW